MLSEPNIDDELSRQYGQMNLSEGMGSLGIDALPLDGDDGLKPDSACNLIVNYLPHDVDDLSLREFGEIIMTKVVRDKNTKKSMGYGFVKFMNESDAMGAIEKMNGYAIGHKNLKVSVARPPSLEIRNCKLYVTNLPKDYSEREVIALFKEFGEIIECRVLKDRNSKVNKGVAFVQFNVKSQANNALSLNGCQLEGSSRPLVVKYAEDQHKKKELSRLHNLTINNAFRGMGGGMPGGMPGSMHSGMPGGMPGGMHSGMPGGMHGGMSAGMHSGMSGGMHNGMPGGMHNGMPGGMHSGMPGGMHSGMPGGMHGGMHGGMPSMGGGMPSMGGGMPSPKPLRMENKGDMLSTAYFYQQQGLPSLYASQASPMSMLQNPLSQPMHSAGSGWFNTLQPPQMSYMQSGLQLGSPLGSQSMEMGFNHSPHLHALAMPLGGHGLPPPMSSQGRPQLSGLPPGAKPPPLGMGMGMGIMGDMDMNGAHGHMQRGMQLGMGGYPAGASLHSPLSSPHGIPSSPSAADQYPSVIISNLPTMVDASLLHEICAPYGRVMSANMEDSRPSPTASNGSASPTAIRGRVQMETIAQAELAAQSLHGAMLFEGSPALQVQISLNAPMSQRRM